MGRGGKKRDKKKDDDTGLEQPMSSVSLSQTSPSAADEEEKRKKESVPSEQASKESTPSASVSTTSSVPVADDLDDGGLGLGLGASKKRPKKKKPAAAAKPKDASVAQPTVLPAQDVPPGFTTQVAPPFQPGSGPQQFAQTQSGPGRQPHPDSQHGPQQYPQLQPGPGPQQYSQQSPSGPAPQHYPQQQPGPGPQQYSQLPPGPVPQQYPQQSGPGPQQYSQLPPGPVPQHYPQQSGPGRGRGHQTQPGTGPKQQPGLGHPTQAQPGPGPQYPQTVTQAAPVHGAVSSASSSGTEVTKSRFAIPKRISGNTVKYDKTNMLTNYLPMKIKDMIIHRYDVIFKPERPKKMLSAVFKMAMNKHFKTAIVAFDQIKNFYSVAALPGVTLNDRFIINVEIVDANGKKMPFEVAIKSTGSVDLGTIIRHMKTGGSSLNPPTEAIQCVDVVLRQGTLESYVKSGRQFFKRPNNPILLGDGLEMWTGLFQSAIFTSRPFVNIDVAHKGFPIHQPLIRALDEFRLDPNRPLDRQHRGAYEGFCSFIKGLRVVARIGGGDGAKAVKREYICNDVAKPPGDIKFTLTDPTSGKQRQMTVADYFIKEKGCRLKYPLLNCLWVGPRDKTIYYPMELLEVGYGQVRSRQLNERQLSTMVREAATPPNVRKEKIEEVIKSMNYSRNDFFKKFGLEIADKFIDIEGKIFPAPSIQVGGGRPGVAYPKKGAWQANQLLEGKVMTTWGIITVEVNGRDANVPDIERLFQSVGREMGMTVEPPILRQFDVPCHRLESIMQEAYDKKLQMLVVIVNSRNKECYSQVKKVAERSVGVLTQCIKDQTASRRMNPQTARNILLKVNSKLMGTNQCIHSTVLPPCMKVPFMVVGADVTHPSPDQTNIPSIAAVTASIDQKCFKYNIEFSIQTPKKEMIVEFEDMMVDHLQMFKKCLKVLPKKIYVFRDGVSEGQFAEVMNSELQAVYNAYARMTGGTGKVEVLFLLVQKRHHTRFFLGNSKENVYPGTCVDSDIVHPTELDFYLVSHQAIKGTARPTRYHVVCNDSSMKHDEVEQLTYYLCHLFSRCTRSVSYPTPTYYAHLACLRARALTMNERFDNAELEKKPRRLRIKQSIQENNPMFFV